ncbi:ribosome maturation factor RimM [Candidatus Chrysopegis kryptomonas]|uniref:Ribosome maturation factor RimM n=1 Tax=Candidatus Chryseopegocella kryptomonas TaxID=1633643 RepID=A0A0P1MTD1_9BACT|nr:ribosome maturation factor RimM [Candidatus Chrysopegis kryptomonas]CUS99266.1 16S rRNA processing protein RimM [Candidatus Chrysopegis kryptomonas]
MGDLCIIGKILRPYGLRGQVCVKPITDFVERFKKLKRVYVGDNPVEVEEHQVVSSFLRDEDVILKFKGVNDRTSAESFSGKFIYIPEEELVPLPEDSFYVHDLIGLKVYDTNGNKIGVITDVWLLPANDVYVVESKGKEILIPAIKDVVKEVDLEKKMMIIELIEGLI